MISIIFWSDGFSVDDGPLRKMDSPDNAAFLDSIKNGYASMNFYEGCQISTHVIII